MDPDCRDHFSGIEGKFLEYDSVGDRARLTLKGVEFMADFASAVNGYIGRRSFVLPSDLTISSLLVMATLALRAEGKSLSGIVSEDLFNARIPAIEMPALVETIRQGVKADLDDQLRRRYEQG